MKRTLLLIISCLCLLPPVTAQQTKRGIALVVTNTAYDSPHDRLACIGDGKAVAEQLKLLGFDVLSIDNAKSSDLRARVKYFADQSKHYEVTLLYYTGHAASAASLGDIDNYLVPVNVDPNQIDHHLNDCLSLSAVCELMAGCRTKIVFLNAQHPPLSTHHSSLSTLHYPDTWCIYSLDSYDEPDAITSLFTRVFVNITSQPGLNINDMGALMIASLRQRSDGAAHATICSAAATDFLFLPADDANAHQITATDTPIDYTTLEFKKLKKMASRGDAAAQYQMGKCYYYGVGIKQDAVKSLEWFKKAAEAGHADAANMAGVQYRNEEGIHKSYILAIAYFRYAASIGSSEALVNLGKYYWGDYNDSTDKKLALDYFWRAAALGNGNAYYELGRIYDKGIMVTRDPVEAQALYARGAELGSIDARKALRVK